MIAIGENKATIYKGDFHPAALYKGDKKIAGYTIEEFSAEGSVTLENCYNDKLHNAQIIGNSIQDGTPTPENPIEVQSVGELVTEGEYAGKYKIPVTARGKNLFGYISSSVANGQTIEQLPNGAIVQGNLGSSSHDNAYDRGWFRPGVSSATGICPVLHTGDIITISADVTLLELIRGDTYAAAIYLYSREGSGKSHYGYKIDVGETKRITAKFTVTNGNKTYFPVITLNSNVVKIENIQIEYGDTATPYEPYIEPQTFNIYLDEPLRKVGDYADYVDFDKREVVRNCGVRYLKDYSWMLSEYEEAYSFSAIDNSVLPRYVDYSKTHLYAFSSHFLCVHVSNSGTVTTAVLMSKWARNIRVNFLKSDFVFESEQDFKEWCTENNAYMIRILAETIEEPIDLPELPTFKGTTIYEIDTQIPATISGKYKKLEDEI